MISHNQLEEGHNAHRHDQYRLRRLLEEQLGRARPARLLRELLRTFLNTLLSAEAAAGCGTEYGRSSSDRINRRNGYRPCDFDTWAGTIDVAIPKLRQGSYLPVWLLERRKRAEQALTSVVATCYLLGVSTRRVDKLAQSLGITSLSKSRSLIWPKTSTPMWPNSAPAGSAWADGYGVHLRGAPDELAG